MQKYFAAANSARGFVSWFDDIFDPRGFERIYIIKGGSGTGKSTLMKNLSARALKSGAVCEYFYCSSDPKSLDGVIIYKDGGGRIGILDGTAPHTTDPKYPGACDEIVNLGEYWCDDILRAERANIIRLTRRKQEYYREAYSSLASAGTLQGALLTEVKKTVLTAKLDAAVSRLMAKRIRECHPGDFEGIKRTLGLSAISSAGITVFDSFDDSELIFEVSDSFGASPVLFDSLIAYAEGCGISYDRAPTPLDREVTEAVRFPELSMSVVSRTARSDKRIINMARFIDKDGFAMLDRGRRKALKKTVRELTENAIYKLSMASRVHAEIEKIYIGAMDFTRLDEAERRLASRMGL